MKPHTPSSTPPPPSPKEPESLDVRRIELDALRAMMGKQDLPPATPSTDHLS